PLEKVPTVHATSLADDLRKGTVEILDVRELGEWEAGHIPAEDASGEPLVRHIPLGSLPERLSELRRDRKVAVHCQGGGRSAIAASLLQAHGFENVVNFSGGFGEWTSRGLAVQKEPADGEPA